MADNKDFSTSNPKDTAATQSNTPFDSQRQAETLPSIPPDSSVPVTQDAIGKEPDQTGINKPRFSVEELYAPTQESPTGETKAKPSNEVIVQDNSNDVNVMPSQQTSELKSMDEALDNTGGRTVPENPPEASDNAKQNPSEVLQQADVDPNAQPASPILEPVQPAPVQQPPQDANLPQPKKKPIKLILFISLLVIVLSVLVVVAVKFAGSGGGKLFGKKGEVIWWGVKLEEVDVQPLIQDYQEDHPDVKITYVKQSPTDYRERLTNALASGSGPDIFEIHNSWPSMFVNELSSIPGEIMSKDEFTKTFFPVVTGDLTAAKGIVGIPLEYDALTLFINEDIFTAGAKSPPNTWDELRGLASDFTERDGDVIIQAGVPMGYTQNIDHWPEILGLMLIQNGASPAIPLGPRAKGAIDYYLLFKTDRVWDQTLPGSTDAFARGKVAMYFGPSSRASDITDRNKDLRFRTVPLPQLPKEKPTDPDYSYATYWVESVWERSRNKEVAWEFLKFMVSRESIEKINLARKGRTNLERVSPRVDMSEIWSKDPVLGSVVTLAPNAKSWYLASSTNDGSTGINTQINQVYEGVISPKSGGASTTLEDASRIIAQILGKYGIPVK